MIGKLNNLPIKTFEGSTTPGLHADIDILRVIPSVNVMRAENTWKKGVLNCLMIGVKGFPQQFVLQVFRSDIQKPVKSENALFKGMFVHHKLDDNTQNCVVLASDFVLKHAQHLIQPFLSDRSTMASGPSASFHKDIDIVHALSVSGNKDNMKHWIQRTKKGHWPPRELLKEAKYCTWFLVPVGHPSSGNDNIQWRLSANLIERKLMFSLNITQLKCYVLLKIIKKWISKKIEQQGEASQGGLTSFHCKTVLFYTIETTQDPPWQECNLAELLKLCLHTLQNFLKTGICPHYIIDYVNLFDGKLNSNSVTQ
ncbi:hypothetical protein DPMN_064428 [Dreissena polymorpha]|uniref:Mab-21-like HhH/H2TH-like domain-containing protein n=1 Tax=Dreissena polymorpha TaxID=45954 RepID=A0A9D4CDF9_DREPO|nr:hypothetical protein DPMN_064428 [Dreissena polymorpha]